MMIFLSLFYLVFYLVGLVKGKLFYNFMIQHGEEEIKKAQQGTDNYKPSEEWMIKAGLTVLVMLTILLVQVIYYCVAVQYDPFVLPTVAMILYFLCIVLKNTIKGGNKKDLTTERNVEKYRKQLQKKRSVRSVVMNLTYVIYFGYMLFSLIFG